MGEGPQGGLGSLDSVRFFANLVFCVELSQRIYFSHSGTLLKAQLLRGFEYEYPALAGAEVTLSRISMMGEVDKTHVYED